MLADVRNADPLAWRRVFERFVAVDAAAAWPWEFVPEALANELRLAHPRTNLGRCRGRFRLLAELLGPHVARGASVCDVGAYPGTMLRLLRQLPGGDRIRLGAAGLGFDPPFRQAVTALDVELIEAEFDVRATAPRVGHLLDAPLVPEDESWDVVVCTEVVEHQLQPLALLIGCHRLVRPGGSLILTTNSASFIGDVLKLLAGRHNISSLEQSHVLLDDTWRPHIRLYLLDEMERLLELAGFQTVRGRYFDNGNVYTGAKGTAIGMIRRTAGVVPRLRSHMMIESIKAAAPHAEALRRLGESFSAFGMVMPGTSQRPASSTGTG
jgi:SAM-dependent methyltransferase